MVGTSRNDWRTVLINISRQILFPCNVWLARLPFHPKHAFEIWMLFYGNREMKFFTPLLDIASVSERSKESHLRCDGRKTARVRSPSDALLFCYTKIKKNEWVNCRLIIIEKRSYDWSSDCKKFWCHHQTGTPKTSRKIAQFEFTRRIKISCTQI